MLPDMAASISASEGFLFDRQQRGGRHHLTGLAVAALRNIQRDPGLLDCVHAQTFDRRDLLAGDRPDRGLAGTDRHAVQVHGTGAAQRLAAAELGASHAERRRAGPTAVVCPARRLRSTAFTVYVERNSHKKTPPSRWVGMARQTKQLGIQQRENTLRIYRFQHQAGARCALAGAAFRESPDARPAADRCMLRRGTSEAPSPWVCR